MKHLIRYLGLDKRPPSSQLVFTRALRAIESSGQTREKAAMKEAQREKRRSWVTPT